MGASNNISATEEKFSDNISSASEASETTNSNFIYATTPNAEMSLARQLNSSDNNNQCLLASNGNILLQLLNPQRPGAIDNQPLVTQEPVKQPATRTQQSNVWVNMGMMSLRLFPQHWPRGNVPSPSAPLKRVLAYTGCFSRTQTIKEIHEYLSQRLRMKEEDMRLWLYNSENYLTLLDDEDHTLEYLNIQDEQHLIIEVRNKDMSWPEEMSFIANSSKIDRHKEKGATGLSNLGNTCFMNSSIQCVSNTQPLTQYFISGRHLYELNRTNPIGMKGHMAKCYGDLIQELWSGTQKNIAPLKLRWTIAKYAPRFNGFQQQDSQELLAFLLDGLHEDLNRVHDKPYVELKDSDGRPDWEVAAEAWENHLRRNRSIVVDLFHGQLRSQVKCKTCGHISVRFDPFNFLSLPLPMDSYMHIEIIDGTTPVRYGLRLNMDEKYSDLKKHLSELCALKPDQILLAEVHSSNIKIAEEHRSVEQSQRAQAEPINLDSCLRAFTSEEELGEDEMYYCSKCRTHCLATKKLDLWRLPPILIIHLKRFQFVNGRWIKSQKIVKFPRESFDPSAFLMPRDLSCWPPKLLTPQADDPAEPLILPEECRRTEPRSGTVAGEGDVLTRSPSSLNTSGILNNIRGIMGGGHYVTYAKNPNDKWYCYNDSSCKELHPDEIDTDSAYILFYEQQGVDYAQFLPKIEGKNMADTSSMDEDFESDYKKYCVLQ
ncbi:Ubiquitin carboxyl-terminal hydrolase 32, partial [Ophiophagus hannah]